MEKTFQYHQQIFAGLELEIYNDLLKKDEIFLQYSWMAAFVVLNFFTEYHISRRNINFVLEIFCWY